MVQIEIIGKVVDVETRLSTTSNKGEFKVLRVQEKQHPTCEYSIACWETIHNYKSLVKGKAVCLDCNVVGNYPFNSIYVNYAITAKNYKQLSDAVSNDVLDDENNSTYGLYTPFNEF